MIVLGGGQSQIGNMAGDIAYQKYADDQQKSRLFEDQQKFNQQHTTNEEQRQNRLDKQNAAYQTGELDYKNNDLEVRTEQNRLQSGFLQNKQEETKDLKQQDIDRKAAYGQQAIDVKKAREQPSNTNNNTTTKNNVTTKTNKVFIPPTIEEVIFYCQERKNSIDPHTFIDFYQARGWKFKTGQPVKDWKACIRTWEARDNKPVDILTETQKRNIARFNKFTQEHKEKGDISGL